MNLPFEHLDEKSREIMVKTIRRRIFDHIGEIVAESPPPGGIVLPGLLQGPQDQISMDFSRDLLGMS